MSEHWSGCERGQAHPSTRTLRAEATPDGHRRTHAHG